jgi:hypothetical protein
MSRKTIVIPIIVLSIALLAITALSGCGSEAATARKYMNQADQAYADLTTKRLELQRQQESILPAIISGDPAKIKLDSSQLPGIGKALASLQDSARTVLADYRKIGSLKDVAEYKTYESMMVASLDMLIASIDTGKALVTEFTNLTNRLNSGAQVDVSGEKGRIFDVINRALDQGTKAQELQKRAKEYQAKHKLAG